MNADLEDIVRRVTGAQACFHIEDIQSLWSGYGKIIRYGLKGAERASVVVKHVTLPRLARHPYGWNTDRSHLRKVKSYQVESAWYRDWAHRCNASCRVPQCLAVESNEEEFLLVFEDLDAGGFSLRKDSASLADMEACLGWLAHFHATFMGEPPTGLWTVGTYWHLDTRPDEWTALNDDTLKQAAARIDQRLSSARFQTLVHGDAKLANFCFANDVFSGNGFSAAGDSGNDGQVAAVDFQYVGGGCGMKDVAYFIGSCLNEEDCERFEGILLKEYFAALGNALARRQSDINPNLVEQEWRALYSFAWTDFHRFLKGWSPGHWKIHSYSERMARRVIAQLSETID